MAPTGRARIAALTAAAVCAVTLVTATASATTTGHDGRIAFNRGGDIYTTDLNGAGLKRLTTNGGGNGWPNWSPDGRKIAWVHRGQVWTMNADGSGKKEFAVGTSPSWSPDGKSIAYAGVDEHTQYCGHVPVVFVKPVAGGAEAVIERYNYERYCASGTKEYVWGNTTAWHDNRVIYGFALNDEVCDPYCHAYGVIDNNWLNLSKRFPVNHGSDDDRRPAPDVDTDPARPDLVWTGAGGVHITRLNGTSTRTVVTDSRAAAPKYDPAGSAIFYTTRTTDGTYLVRRIGLTRGSTSRTVLRNASQAAVQPAS